MLVEDHEIKLTVFSSTLRQLLLISVIRTALISFCMLHFIYGWKIIIVALCYFQVTQEYMLMLSSAEQLINNISVSRPTHLDWIIVRPQKM